MHCAVHTIVFRKLVFTEAVLISILMAKNWPEKQKKKVKVVRGSLDKSTHVLRLVQYVSVKGIFQYFGKSIFLQKVI